MLIPRRLFERRDNTLVDLLHEGLQQFDPLAEPLEFLGRDPVMGRIAHVDRPIALQLPGCGGGRLSRDLISLLQKLLESGHNFIRQDTWPNCFNMKEEGMQIDLVQNSWIKLDSLRLSRWRVNLQNAERYQRINWREP